MEFDEILAQIRRLSPPAVVAIDGRCGSGKTTLGARLAQALGCPLVHMDDFYRPPREREANWMEIPGGNMDLERLKQEVLVPFLAGEGLCYRPWHCASGQYGPGVEVAPGALLVLEGSYAHHPQVRGLCALKLFVTCPPAERVRRLKQREGERFARFQTLWMPLEERYFAACSIPERADVVIETGE